MRALLLLGLLFSGVLSSLTAAEVQVDAQCPWVDRDGYTPVLLTVRSGLPIATTVEVDGTLLDNHTSMAIAVPPGAVVTRTLLLPGAARSWGSSIDLRWRAPGQPEERVGVSPRGHRELDVVVLDPDERWPVKDVRAAVAAVVGAHRETSGGSSSSTYTDERFNRWSPAAMPDRWQGFPAWLTVITTPAGDRALTDGQRAALAVWTHAGGRLFVTEVAQIAPWRALGAQVAEVAEPVLAERIRAVWSQQDRTTEEVPVPGTGRVPVYGFVGIALLFSLVVGPLNFWWCARTGRRYLLLLTTPLLSLAASVVLLAYGLVSDGIGIQRVVVQVLALDQPAGRAGTWTSMTIFAGLAPSTVDLDGESLLTAQVARENHNNSQSPVSLAWTSSGQQASGWIPSRINRQLTVASVVPEKRRLLFAKDGDGWRVTNGFDLVLEDLAWRDPHGRPWHLGGSLAAGGDGPLTPGATVIAPPLGRLPSAALQAVEGSAWTARFSGALLPIPGPVATDAVPVVSWVIGRGAATAATGPAAGTEAPAGGF